MRQNPCYLQMTIKDKTYLLPSGQAVSDHKKAILLNETGAYIWQLLSQETDFKTLLSRTAEYFEISAGQQEAFQSDITDYLNSLLLKGVILSELSVSQTENDDCTSLSIAGLTLNLVGPREAFAPSLFDFAIPHTPQADQTVLVLYGNPAARENGRLLVRNQELTVIENSEKYILLFHTYSCVRELHLKKDASLATFYCIPSTSALQENLFHAMRHAFLYLALQNDILAVHSASILYRDKAWLFSAPSGTGKSTHAGLWQTIAGTTLINGDLNLIRLADGHPVVLGLPWCGTSGIYDKHSHELGGVIFLKRALSDSIETLPEDTRILSLSNRMISPNWDVRMLEKQIRLTGQIADRIFLCRLLCTKEPSAQKLMQETIDSYLSVQL